MPVRLHVIDGPDKGRIYPLPEAGVVVIGNSHKNTDICIHDLVASRFHCEVQVDGDVVVVNDLDDSSGTYVNSQKIRQQAIMLHDVVRAGNTFLRLESADEAVAPSKSTVVEEADDLEVVDDGTESTEEGADEAEVVEAAEEAEEEEEDVVEAEVAEHDPTILPDVPLDRLDELSDHNLSHYRLGAVLGQGNFGVVFQAAHLETNEVVAVKVLAPTFPHTEQEMKHYVQTLKAMLPWRHPHLVSLLGAGKARRYCWIAMEYVEGENVAEIRERVGGKSKIDWRRACRVACHIGRALDFAHKHNAVHRNVTDRNILYQTETKTAKLNDLFLLRALHGTKLKAAVIDAKREDEVAFLAPEQTMTPPHVDARSDIYSLGVAVYGLCTGHYPFEGKTPAEIIAKIREGKPARPTKLQPTIPEAFERVILRMLAKMPEDRHESAAEMVAEVEKIAKKEGVDVDPKPTEETA
jgi:pSer/pThr/pTyr-binding forkhead associated (FHA) protein